MSTNDKEKRIEWFKSARFGMFIHWGVYSAIAKGEWYLRNSQMDVNEYMNHANLLNVSNDTIENWVILAKKAGMRYIVLTTKHHDGFCLFKTKTTPFNSVDMGPKKDFIAEFVRCCRKHDIRIGFYFSLIDWSQTEFVRKRKENFVLFLNTIVKPQIKELISNYGTIDIWWYDGFSPGDPKRWHSQALNRMIRKQQPEIIFNNRNGLSGDFDTPEQHLDASERMWETCMTLNDSWGYRKFDNNWKSSSEIIKNLAVCTHYAGNFLLNVGPDGNGIIPENCVNHLLEIGKFLKKSHEAFRNTTRSPFGMEPNRFFAVRDKKIYLHVLSQFWQEKALRILGIKNRITNAYYLESGKKIHYKQTKNIIVLENLTGNPPNPYDVIIVMEFSGKPESSSYTHNWSDL